MYVNYRIDLRLLLGHPVTMKILNRRFCWLKFNMYGRKDQKIGKAALIQKKYGESKKGFKKKI